MWSNLYCYIGSWSYEGILKSAIYSSLITQVRYLFDARAPKVHPNLYPSILSTLSSTHGLQSLTASPYYHYWVVANFTFYKNKNVFRNKEMYRSPITQHDINTFTISTKYLQYDVTHVPGLAPHWLHSLEQITIGKILSITITPYWVCAW